MRRDMSLRVAMALNSRPDGAWSANDRTRRKAAAAAVPAMPSAVKQILQVIYAAPPSS